VRGEGWKWVEILQAAQYPDLTKFGRIHPVHVPVTPEIRSEIEALEAEQEQINQAHQEAEEYPPDVDARMSEIEMRIDELNDQARQYREEEIRLAGAIVFFENLGQAVIYRGLVRSEDRKKVQAVKFDSDGQHEPDDDEGEESDDVNLSGALVEDLTAHRTAALRVVLATRPDVALVAAAHSLALRVCYEGCYEGFWCKFQKRSARGHGALGERESLACQIGPKFKLCTRSYAVFLEAAVVFSDKGRIYC
jgi:ParB family chromosome partitioning protein